MSHRPLIGMMLGWKVKPDLMRACTLSAAYYGADLYYFYTWDVKEDSITGMQLIDNQWVQGEFRYPDVIYDNTRRRGHERYEDAYRKLDGIPMGHTLKGRGFGKTKIYNLIRHHEELKKNLIPFMTMKEPDKVMGFIEKHKRVILKPDGGYMGRNALTVQLTEDGIEVFDQEQLHMFSREEMLQVIETLIPKKFCAQKLIRSETSHGYPFHIRVHLSKNGQNEWVVAFKSVTLSLRPHIKITNSDSTYRGTSTWADFLLHRFGEKVDGEMDNQLRDYGLELAAYLDEAIGGGFHELGLDIGVDKKNRIWLFEAGLALPRSPYYQMQLSVPAMAHCMYLYNEAQQSKGTSNS